jgi:glycosyltransferase involved in cell wall biosynthesis
MALETARLGHDVVVLTQTECQAEIERALATGSVPNNLKFDIFMPAWLQRLRSTGLSWQVVSVLWQICVLNHARRRYGQGDVDLVHHVTFAGVRHPTLLTRLGLPTVIGPLGGGESAPMALRKSFNWKDWCLDLLRDAHTLALRCDPMTREAFRDAQTIILRTEESIKAVPPSFRNKVIVDVGLGIEAVDNVEMRPHAAGEPFHLLYAGRLQYWKGVHLAIRSLAAVRSRGVDARLTIVGSGPMRRQLERLASDLALDAHVIWRGQVARHELFDLYRDHHAFLYPSLHDASGTVILEALAHGLPVICLGLGGPGKMVDETCGCVVPVAGRSEADCVAALAMEVAALADEEDRRAMLARAAIARSKENTWPKVVAGLYDIIRSRMAAEAEENAVVATSTG